MCRLFRSALDGLLLVAVTLSAGCADGQGLDAWTEGDGQDDAGDGDSDGEERDADVGDAEVGGDAAGGEVTLVLRELTVLEDRPHDFDGDGIGDNAVADLGSPSSSVFALAFGAMLATAFDVGSARLLLRLPWVDDLARLQDPDTIVIVFAGRDVEYPAQYADDFSGEEPFYVEVDALDACGEPRSSAAGALAAGEISVEVEHVGLPVGPAMHRAWLRCTLGEGGVSGEGLNAAYWLVADLGAAEGFANEGFSALEEFLAGGARFGLPQVPGLSPDVDVDGDGTEQVLLDGAGHVAGCIDGDGTPIEGPDCWRDERIADGISFVLGYVAVRARFAGRRPGWEYGVTGACPGGPPEQSLFGEPVSTQDACAETEGLCDPLLPLACCNPDEVCSGANACSYRCLRRCVATPCDYGGSMGMCEPLTTGSQDGFCRKVFTNADPGSDCAPGETGCSTSYGVHAETLCVVFDAAEEVNRCVEQCDATPSGCEGGDRQCIPLADGDGGVCATWEHDV